MTSQVGASVAEAYYQQIGQFGIDTASTYYGFGAGVVALSLGLGAILISENKMQNKQSVVVLYPSILFTQDINS